MLAKWSSAQSCASAFSLGPRCLTPAGSEAGVRRSVPPPSKSLFFSQFSSAASASLSAERGARSFCWGEGRAARKAHQRAPAASTGAPSSERAPVGAGTRPRGPAGRLPCAAQMEAAAELSAQIRPIFCVWPDPRVGPGRGEGTEATLWFLAPLLAPNPSGFQHAADSGANECLSAPAGLAGFGWAAAGPPRRPLCWFSF